MVLGTQERRENAFIGVGVGGIGPDDGKCGRIAPARPERVYVIRVEWPEEWVVFYFFDWEERRQFLQEFKDKLPYEIWTEDGHEGKMMKIIEKGENA